MVLSYINGNRLIKINLNTGEKRRYKPINDNNDYMPIFPENIDVNLSYNCSNNCNFCYINANKKGKIASINNIKYFYSILNEAPKGIELAINFNSGNFSIKVFKDFINIFKNKHIINVTTRFDIDNLKLLKEYQEKNLIYGIGVSLDKNKEIEQINSILNMNLKNVNFHTINGINNIECIIDNFKNINLLILGFKFIGKGKNKKPNLINNWNNVFNKAKINNITLIFDNLCIKQIITTGYQFDKNILEKRFLGEDGTSSCYIDLVELKSSKNSILYNEKNFSIENKKDIKEIFNITKNM